MKQAEITKEVPLESVKRVHGVTFDGRSVWFAADDGDLIELDPESGRTRSRTHVGSRAGITFDGEAIWAICGDKIHRIDPKTREIVKSIPTPPGQVAGMAWAEGALWIGLYAERKVMKIDPKDGRVLKSIALNRLVTGVTWADGELWHGTVGEKSQAGGLHRIDPETGVELDEVRFPSRAGASGVEYDRARGVFWCGAHDGDAAGRSRIRAVRKPTAS
jgi:streptogramin lyase